MNDSIKEEKKGPRATIIAALIGAVALILATVITLVFTTGDDKGKNVSITQPLQAIRLQMFPYPEMWVKMPL
jgi:hypothetical protein